MSDIFTALQLGSLSIKNRIIMAPLTRGRASKDGIPNELMAEYYAQRASAGLIIAEATAVCPQGYGWVQAPGIWNNDQVDGWKKVTEAVHEAGGSIFLQLWHMGRTVHPDFLGGEKAVAPSAIKADAEAHTPDGKKPLEEPRALNKNEIPLLIENYIHGAEKAVKAGFDGVEVHAANGYLLDEFIRDGSNKREDEYGGSVENRIRLTLEVTRAVIDSVGSDRTGIRISPTNPFNDMKDSDPVDTFTTLATELNELNLAYLHVMEPDPELGHFFSPADAPYVLPHIREAYKGNIIANGGYTKKTGSNAIRGHNAHAIAYGVPFLANPDLPERFKQDAKLNEPDQDTFYTHEAKGYTDYPTLSDKQEAA